MSSLLFLGTGCVYFSSSLKETNQDRCSFCADDTQGGYHKCGPIPQWRAPLCQGWMIFQISLQRSRSPALFHTPFRRHRHAQSLPVRPWPCIFHRTCSGSTGLLQGYPSRQQRSEIGCGCPIHGRSCLGFQLRKWFRQDATLRQRNSQNVLIVFPASVDEVPKIWHYKATIWD